MQMVMPMMIILALMLCVFLLVLSKRLGNAHANSEHAFEPFYVSGDYLVANSLIAGQRYYLDEILHVQFGCAWRKGGWYGTFRVHKKLGRRGRKYMFDGSAYTRRRQMRSTREEIEQAIAMLQATLRTHGIPSVVKR